MYKLLCILLVAYGFAQGDLQSYNIISNTTSVSGLSAGAYFATQFQVAFSSHVMGAGIVSGGPYGCAELNMQRALIACMSLPSQIDVSKLVAMTKRFESERRIDALANMATHKTYVFHGTLDSTIRLLAGQKLADMYTQLGVKPVTNFNMPAQHAMITDDYGNGCSFSGSPWINNCRFDLAGTMLKHFYGELNPPTTPKDENLLKFNQRTFTSSLGSLGLVYVPTSCKAGNPCKLHVAFHGCEQYYDNLQDIFAKNSGYNKWAESNGIIVLYPQSSSTWAPMNPKGCFDWFGYSSSDAYWRTGPQMDAVKRMIDKLSAK
jgi:predicted esterase